MLDPSGLPIVLAVADGRFPVGGHAHSSGLEAAHRLDGATTPDDLRAFLHGRLSTSGVTEANLIAGIMYRIDLANIDWELIDAEIDARIPNATLRSTSRLLGRHWVRAATRVGAGESLGELLDAVAEPHQVAVFALVSRHWNIDPSTAVAIHLHHLSSSVTGAATRLSGIDPYIAQEIHLEQSSHCAQVARDACSTMAASWASIPAPSGPAAEVGAAVHRTLDGRLFRS